MKGQATEKPFDIFFDILCSLSGESNLDKRQQIWGLFRILFDSNFSLWRKGLKLIPTFKIDLDLAIKNSRSVKVFGKIEAPCKTKLIPEQYQKLFNGINVSKLYERLEIEEKERLEKEHKGSVEVENPPVSVSVAPVLQTTEADPVSQAQEAAPVAVSQTLLAQSHTPAPPPQSHVPAPPPVSANQSTLINQVSQLESSNEKKENTEAAPQPEVVSTSEKKEEKKLE